MSRKLVAFTMSLAAGALLSASGFAAEAAVESVWTAVPVVIDGGPKDWDALSPIIEEGTRVEYALQNDGKNLYIIMVFKEPPDPRAKSAVFPKSTVDYTGMRIYFTTGAKKSKDYGILFQKKQYTADALIASMKKRGQTPTEAQMAEIRKKPSHIVFTGEVIKPKKAVAPTDPAVQVDPPLFSAADLGRVSVHEYRIPLSQVNQLGGIGAEPGQSILLGFEWGGMTNQIMQDMMAGRADESVSSSERGVAVDRGFGDASLDPDSGGGRGGRFGDSSFNRNPRFAKHAFWIQAKLAAKKD